MHRAGRRRCLAMAAVAFAIAICLPTAAFALNPTAPTGTNAWVSGLGKVTVTWTASTDGAGHPITYTLYRYRAPIKTTNIASAEVVVSGLTTTTVEVNANAQEMADAYVWLYAVRAFDGLGGVSAISGNAAPDLHLDSAARFAPSVSSCPRCHQIHVPRDVDHTAVELCYFCHGSTSASSATGARSTLNTQADFYDYGGQTPGSQHRNATMTADRTECDACHDPHRFPKLYTNAGVYDPANSYRKLLGVLIGREAVTNDPLYRPYGVATDTAQNTSFCFDCHGSTSTSIAYVGGSSAYAASSGDHNQASYATSAHGTSNVTSSDTDPALPQIQCLACHDKHASAADQLIAYRGQDTTTTTGSGTFAQADLCFACHSAAGYARETAAGTASGDTNLAWNKRDVKAQFQKVSHHPMSVATGGPTAQSGTWTQTTQADFQSDTLVNTVATVTHNIELAPSGGNYVASGTAVSTAIAPAGTLQAWSTLGFSETQPAGTDLTVDVLDAADNSVLIANAGTGTDLSALTAASLKLRANLSATAAAPRSLSDDFNDNSFDTAKWTDRFLNSTDPDSPATVNLNTVTFQTALIDPTTGMDSRNPNDNGTGWYRNTNTGSDGNAGYARTGATEYDAERSMLKSYGDLSAYSSASASFYWRNGNSTMTTGDYLYVEWSANGGSTWTTIGSVTSTAADGTWGQLSNASLPVGTNCQLRVRSRVQDAINDEWYLDTIAVTVSSPASTIWPREASQQLSLRAEGAGFTGTADQGEFTYIAPSQFAGGWVNTADFDLKVYLGAVRYNTPQAGLMIRTGTTEANAYATNAAFVGLWATGGTTATFAYRGTAGGSVTTNGTTTTALPEWLRITRTGNSFAAYISDDGSTWTQVGSNQSVTMGASVLVGLATSSASGTNNNFSEADYDTFSVTERTYATSTPALHDWAVTYTYFPASSSGSISCVNCHNTHSVVQGTTDEAVPANWWSMGRASNPNDTQSNYAGDHRTQESGQTSAGTTLFCLECHDGTPPAASTESASVLVPYAVSFSAPSALLFPGWNKQAAGANWAGGAHDLSGVSNMTPECSSCHDPHASDNPRLLALTAWRPAGGTHVNAIRDNTTTYAEQALCYACHGSANTCDTAGCHGSGTRTQALMDVQEPFALTYRHPVDASGRHSDIEAAADLGPAVADRHAECADCHDPHAAARGTHTTGDSTAGNALRGAMGITVATWPGNWTAVPLGSWTAQRVDGQDADFEAYVCFKCHSSYSGQPFSITSNGRTYTSTDVAREFNPSNQSEHNVLGQRTVMETAFTVGGSPYTWSKPADNAFLDTVTTDGDAAWTSNSQMTCTDCHSNNSAAYAKGPHGSSTPWMMADGFTTWTNTTALNAYSGVICAKCHANLATSNDVHNAHDSRGAQGGYCRFCHVKVPHGWKRPRLIGYTTDDAAYATIANGVIEIELKSYTYNGWSEGDCYAGCSTSRHPDQPVAWP